MPEEEYMKDTKESILKEEIKIEKREAFMRVFKKYFALRPEDVIIDVFISELEEAGLKWEK